MESFSCEPENVASHPLCKHILNGREIVLDFRDCFASDHEMVDAKDAIGRISAEIKIVRCPLEVPVLLMGERIKE